MKELYESPEMDVVTINAEDIIFASGESSCPPAEQ